MPAFAIHLLFAYKPYDPASPVRTVLAGHIVKLKLTIRSEGDNPLLYPSNNWINQLIKNYTQNQRFNLNISGGGEKAQYYISGTYNIDNGVLKSVNNSTFNNNIKLGNYAVRSNVNIEINAYTTAIVRTSAQFDDITAYRWRG